MGSDARRTSVLHAVGVLIDGGVPIYVMRLARAQRDAGQRPLVACDPASHMWKMLEQDGSGIERVQWTSPRLRPVRLARSYRSLTSIIEAHQPDVLHLHSSLSGLVGRSRNNDGRSVVFQPHAWSFNALPPSARPFCRLYERRFAHRADLLICGSDDEAEEGRRAGIAVPIRTVANAVDIEEFVPIDGADRAQLRQNVLGDDADGPVVVSVGRLAAQKGPQSLLAAWGHVERKVPGARLYLVGDGPLRAELEAIAPASVHLVGKSSQPLAWHQIADLSVYPSEYDTLSLALLEALACGSPIVATRVSGAQQAVATGPESAAGRLVDIGDVEALATAIVEQLLDPENAVRTRAAARTRALLFDQRPWAKDLVNIYEELAR